MSTVTNADIVLRLQRELEAARAERDEAVGLLREIKVGLIEIQTWAADEAEDLAANPHSGPCDSYGVCEKCCTQHLFSAIADRAKALLERDGKK